MTVLNAIVIRPYGELLHRESDSMAWWFSPHAYGVIRRYLVFNFVSGRLHRVEIFSILRSPLSEPDVFFSGIVYSRCRGDSQGSCRV